MILVNYFINQVGSVLSPVTMPLVLMGFTASTLVTVFLSLERYFAICRKKPITYKKVYISMAVIGIYSFEYRGFDVVGINLFELRDFNDVDIHHLSRLVSMLFVFLQSSRGYLMLLAFIHFSRGFFVFPEFIHLSR